MKGFGVIGVGTWGELHARVYSNTPGACLAAVCDRDSQRARQVAEACGAERVYQDYQELLADETVEAVSIVLPDFLHREAAVAAAAAGKHILVEKPLATTEEDGRAIIDAAEKAGVTLFVDFHNRWNPLFQPLKEALESGELGEPQRIDYRLDDTLFVPTRMLRWAAQSSPAWFLGSHCLDTLLWLMNSRQAEAGGAGDTIERLYCVTRSRLLQSLYGVNTPDFFDTILEWKSGLVTHLQNGWILPDSGPSIFDLKFEFVGSKGSISVDGSHHRAVQKQTGRLLYPDVLVAPMVHGQPVGFAAESIRHFANSIIHGRQPMVDGLDGLAVTRLILRMEESARAGSPVSVGPLFDR